MTEKKSPKRKQTAPKFILPKVGTGTADTGKPPGAETTKSELLKEALPVRSYEMNLSPTTDVHYHTRCVPLITIFAWLLKMVHRQITVIFRYHLM